MELNWQDCTVNESLILFKRILFMLTLKKRLPFFSNYSTFFPPSCIYCYIFSLSPFKVLVWMTFNKKGFLSFRVCLKSVGMYWKFEILWFEGWMLLSDRHLIVPLSGPVSLYLAQYSRRIPSFSEVGIMLRSNMIN